MSNVVLGALAGAAGGIAGSWMMVRFNHLIDHDEEPGGAERAPQYRTGAKPNDTDGTITDEPGSMQAASAVAEMVRGRPLDEREKRIGGPIAHYAFGAVAGGLYGAIAETNRAATAGFGLPFGAAVWLAADEIGMPLLGFATNPAHYPASRHAAALGTHLVYGATVEGVRRIFRGGFRRYGYGYGYGGDGGHGKGFNTEERSHGEAVKRPEIAPYPEAETTTAL